MTVENQARQSHGVSAEAIYRMVERAVRARHDRGGTLVDVGCGTGRLWGYLGDSFDHYVGIDLVRYAEFPETLEFRSAELNTDPVPVTDGLANVTAAIETVEHLENPRGFMRELVRVTRPGGWVVVTTPNQHSMLSLLTLVVKRRFNHFQDVHYPAHITALLEVDLRRIATEAGLEESVTDFSLQGRLPGSGLQYPRWVSRLFPRACSDNTLLVARRPA